MPEEQPQRRLAAILAADVAGFSALMERAEDATYDNISRLKRDIIEPALARHKGRLIKTTGDGFLAEFASPVAAVRCGVDIQEQLATGAGPLRLRIGINLGDIIVDGQGDMYGDGVNIAARLEGMAEPGGILISGKVHSEVVGKLEGAFEDRGELQLKNISRPIRAYSVRARGQSAAIARVSEPRHPPAALPLPDKPSIAVLPFQNMSGDPEQEYFADGMVEDIITALSRFRSLFVIARNSSFTYKGKSVDIKQIGRELGVRYVLEGSVRKSANRLRITGQLIEAATGTHLWADKIDGDLVDVFDLQDRITSSVVGVVAPTIEQAEVERARQKPTDRLDSYDFYLRGSAIAHRGSSDAFELFKKAIERDKEFAAAYAMAAFVLIVKQGRSGSVLPDRLRDEAVAFAEHAVRLGRGDAAVLARSAHVLAYLARQYDRAALLANEAVALNANLAIAWHSRGWVALMSVVPDLAIESFERMMRLSPLDPLIPLARCGIAFACFQASRYEEGFEIGETLTQMAPSAHSFGAFIVNAVALGRMAEAENAATRLLRREPTFRVLLVPDIFPMRTPEMQNKIADALRKAGLPD